jgi:phage major head subunit gpT-like protein
MPIITNTQNSLVRAANTVMARSFFPRFKDSLYKAIAGSYVSTSLVEPFTMIGAMPGLKLYNGALKFGQIPSFTLQVPNPLFKTGSEIGRTEFEGDQTGTLIKLSSQLGSRLAEFPDQLLAKRLLAGSTAGSQYMTFRGTQYTMTMDAQPFFSSVHSDWYSGGNQSNIIQGTLPSTKAAMLAQGMATTAGQLQSDISVVIDKLSSVRDNAGIPFFPTIDTGKSVIVLVPRIMEPAAKLAFRTQGSVIAQTTNIIPMFVKDVLTSGYLGGNFVDPETDTTISPINETDYYVFIIDDWVKPFYMQLFRPPTQQEMFPRGYDAGAEIDRLLDSKSDVPIDRDGATAFASSMVETTFQRQGANADAWTIINEAFVMSARWRGNIAYGPWFTAYRVVPVGGS